MEDLLIANRGEIAVRIIRAAQELGISTTAVLAEDDEACLHVRKADRALPLTGSGARAYLDGAQIAALAAEHGCDAVHPGYGFLSESAEFAEQVAARGLTFVGPDPDALRQFGDKAQARTLAEQCGVPVLDGVSHAVDVEEAQQFLARHAAGGIIIKAVSGGGGRGMRVVVDPAQVSDAHARASSEAQAAFGSGEVYVEQFVSAARHVEVQIIGDGSGAVSHLWERECSAQRRHQKIVEIAPSPGLAEEVRQAMCDAAVTLGKAVNYRGLGTIEFLLDPQSGGFYFMEANARLQVEHTVTEEVTGIDLVQAQIRVAQSTELASLGLSQDDIPQPRGHAIQLRINMETVGADGSVKPDTQVIPPTRTMTRCWPSSLCMLRAEILPMRCVGRSAPWTILSLRVWQPIWIFWPRWWVIVLSPASKSPLASSTNMCTSWCTLRKWRRPHPVRQRLPA